MEIMQQIFKRIASWLFLIGILVAVIVGLVAQNLWMEESTVNGVIEETIVYPTYITMGLAVLGFIVGILSFFAIGNITGDRVPTFLIAALILVGIGAISSVGWFENLKVVGTYFQNITTTLALFAAPAAGILAIRAIWDAGKTEEIEKVVPKIPE
jgi:hypothetical protein